MPPAPLTKLVNPISVEFCSGLDPNPLCLTVQAAADPLVIELFAGAARVTACLKQFGLASAAGVDVDCSKPVSTCLQADLSTLGVAALCCAHVRHMFPALCTRACKWDLSGLAS